MVAHDEPECGPSHPRLAASLQLLGQTFTVLGNHDEATRCYHRAAAIAERVGDPHATAQVDHHRAILLYKSGQFAAAAALYRRVLRVYEAQYGPDHELLVMVRTDLAASAAGMGDCARAAAYTAEAAAISRRGQLRCANRGCGARVQPSGEPLLWCDRCKRIFYCCRAC